MNYKKYKVMFAPEEMGDKEIDSFKNFDAVLQEAVVRKSRLQLMRSVKIVLLLLIFSTTAILVFKAGRQSEWFSHTLENGSVAQRSNPVVTSKAKPVVSQQGIPSLPSQTGLTPVGKPTRGKKSKQGKSAESPASMTHQENPMFREAEPVEGYNHLFAFFKDNLKYPEEAKQKGVSGAVVVEFYINEQGHPYDVAIIESANSLLNEEAKRLIVIMPAWKPAMVAGKAASTRQVIPITFDLEKTN